MLDRRKFLKDGLTLLSLGATAPSFLVNTLAQQRRLAEQGIATAQWAAAAANKFLVVVQLGGGNDGLNMVIPYGDQVYYDSRPNLGIREDKVLKLNNSIGFPVGLHPRMNQMKDLFDQGKGTLIQGVGYPNPNRSHFRAMDIWQTAEPVKEIKYGWLAKYFDTELANDPAVLKGVNIGGTTPVALMGETASPSIQNINTYSLSVDNRYPGDKPNRLKVFEQVMSEQARSEDLQYIQQTALEANISSVELLAGVGKYPALNAPLYPAGSFGAGMKLIAQIIAGDLGVRVFYNSIGGFDTHAQQVVTADNTTGSHANLMGQLSDSLGAFWTDMKRLGRENDVMILTFSEFGRRIKENGSSGTDHGTALPMFLFGTGLKTNVLNAHPSLTANLNQGDLGFTMDFRSMYATVLERWLGANSTAILGQPWPLLDVL